MLTMKKNIILFVILSMMLIITGCGSNNGSNEVKAIDSDKATDIVQDDNLVGDKETEVIEEEKEEVFYKFIYYKQTNSVDELRAIKTDGSIDQLGSVYGRAKMTSDGKYVVYRQNKNGSVRVFSKCADSLAVELVEDADGFYLDPYGDFLFFYGDSGLYYTDDISSNAEYISDLKPSYDNGVVFFTSADNNFAYFVAGGNEEPERLVQIPLNNVSNIKDLNLVGKHIYKRITSKGIYYFNYIEDGDGFEVHLIDVNGNISPIECDGFYEEGNILEVGERSYYLNENGELLDVTGCVEMLSACSENEKYFVTITTTDLYRYDITETGFTNETILDGEFTSFYVNDDGTIVASECNEDYFGIYDGEKFVTLAEEFLLVDRISDYHNGTLYYICEDGKLYSYNLSGEKEFIAENVNSVKVIDDTCYYISNWDSSRDCGDLYEVGNNEKIASGVFSIED